MKSLKFVITFITLTYTFSGFSAANSLRQEGQESDYFSDNSSESSSDADSDQEIRSLPPKSHDFIEPIRTFSDAAERSLLNPTILKNRPEKRNIDILLSVDTAYVHKKNDTTEYLLTEGHDGKGHVRLYSRCKGNIKIFNRDVIFKDVRTARKWIIYKMFSRHRGLFCSIQ